jgi:methyl-accepting chemotaxis protein
MKAAVTLALMVSALALAPLSISIGYSLYALGDMGGYSREMSASAMDGQLEANLENQVAATAVEMQDFINERTADAASLESSTLWEAYFSARGGEFGLFVGGSQAMLGMAALGLHDQLLALDALGWNSTGAELLLAGTDGDGIGQNGTAARMFSPGYFGPSGHFFIMSTDLGMVVHPTLADGESLLEQVPSMSKMRDTVLNSTGVRTGAEFSVFEYNWNVSGPGGPAVKMGIVYTFFEPYQWILCAQGCYQELMASAPEAARQLLDTLVADYLKTKTLAINGTGRALYDEVIGTDLAGLEIASACEGVVTTNLSADHSPKQWFRAASILPEGGFYFSPVEYSADCGDTMVLATPIFMGGARQGVLALVLAWSAVTDILTGHKLGSNGYFYMLNEQGVLVSDPVYGIKDNRNLSDPENGAELAAIVSGRMLRGETGFDEYGSDAGDMFVGYTPLDLGGKRFVIAATIPVKEVDAPCQALGQALDGKTQSALVAALSLFAVTAIVVSVLVIAISTGITKPVTRMRDDVEKLASGDLSVHIDYVSKDELGELSTMLNRMVEDYKLMIDEIARVSSEVADGNLAAGYEVELKKDFGRISEANTRMIASLSELISQLQESASVLAATSQELASSSEEMNASTQQVSSAIQQISKGSQSQAVQVEETAKVMKELSRAVEEVALRAQSAASLGKETIQTSESGRKAVRETVGKMQAIQKVVNNSASSIGALGKRSEEIGQIVNFITNITDQTNLLALNAAIEAARAGEQGRGFAVVADEVKNLAEESREAAEKIARMVKDIQAETASAVAAMQVGTREVEDGMHAVEATDNAFGDILSRARAVSEETASISSASQQMKAGTERVAKAMDNVASIAEETASASEESASSTEELTASMEEMTARAQELSNMSLGLQKSAGRFRLPGKAAAAPAERPAAPAGPPDRKRKIADATEPRPSARRIAPAGPASRPRPVSAAVEPSPVLPPKVAEALQKRRLHPGPLAQE